MFSQLKAASDFNEASLPLHMETSCGVVLVNLGTVLLLQYPQGHWDFPKGHVEETDADHFATTRRELAEETGIEEIHFVEDFVERSEYSYRHKGKKHTKQVYWYLAETERITVTLSHEHRGHMWLDWDQAEEQLTHDETRKILKNARNHMRSIGKE
ncbi:MAG: diadenosine tetraphosphate hydrolase [Methanobacteriota archaeon]|nr:MAG: diadenosine tetraphosphate hydrolase [Euryarchaeota archaeon]